MPEERVALIVSDDAHPTPGTPRNRLRRAAGVAPGRGRAKRHAVREDGG